MNVHTNKFLGLIGLGYWGKNILRNLYDLGNLHTVCDLSKDIIAERKKQYPDVHYTTVFDDILRNPDIKAVAIATPAATHYSLVKRYLLAGKDVYVEKPLALTVKEGEELVELAEKENRILMVGHILQYHPAVTKLKKLISAGKLGKIQYVYSNRLNIGKLRTEENILWSFAPHDISVMLMLLEEEPLRVSSTGGDYLNKGICDTTLTSMQFRNGVLGHIFVSWLHPFKEQKLVVVGSKAMCVFDDLTQEKLFIYNHTIEWPDGKIPIAQKADHTIVDIEKAEPLKEELKHYTDCVIKRKRPRTDGLEGLKVLRILEAAEQSMLTQKGSTSHQHHTRCHIHESAYVDDDCRIGDGTRIWHFTHVLTGSRIGRNCNIGQNVVIGPDVSIGNQCKIQNNVSIFKGVTLEDEVFCGPSMVFTNIYNPRAEIRKMDQLKSTLVKHGATLGGNCTIVCGVIIGRYAMVGAGAVVKTDVPDYAIYAGVPAKQIGWACRCGETLRFTSELVTCSHCTNQYRTDDHNLIVIKENNN